MSILYLAMAGRYTCWAGAVYSPIGSNRTSWQGRPRSAPLDALGGGISEITKGYFNNSSSTHRCACCSCRQGMSSVPFVFLFVVILLLSGVIIL
jgi:hypothetical protein